MRKNSGCSRSKHVSAVFRMARAELLPAMARAALLLFFSAQHSFPYCLTVRLPDFKFIESRKTHGNSFFSVVHPAVNRLLSRQMEGLQLRTRLQLSDHFRVNSRLLPVFPLFRPPALPGCRAALCLPTQSFSDRWSGSCRFPLQYTVPLPYRDLCTHQTHGALLTSCFPLS